MFDSINKEVTPWVATLKSGTLIGCAIRSAVALAVENDVEISFNFNDTVINVTGYDSPSVVERQFFARADKKLGAERAHFAVHSGYTEKLAEDLKTLQVQTTVFPETISIVAVAYLPNSRVIGTGVSDFDLKDQLSFASAIVEAKSKALQAAAVALWDTHFADFVRKSPSNPT